MRTSARRDGFTQLELLVAIAILGVLAAIIIPAVQAARESSRRTQCQSHLRNFGDAIHAYEATMRHWPPKMDRTHQQMFPSGSTWQSRTYYSTHVLLLPFLEMTPLWSRIDMTQPAPPHHARKLVGEPFTEVVPIFLCPSDRGEFGTNFRFCTGAEVSWAEASGAFADLDGNGAKITDGLSNTAAMSERIKADERIDPYDWQEDYWFTGVANLPGYTGISADDLIPICMANSPPPPLYDPFVGHTWQYAAWDTTWYNHAAGPNSRVPDCTTVLYDPVTTNRTGIAPGIYSARSRHPGGVNLLMMDGAVRFVSENIDLATWRAVATRADGESASNL